MRFVLILLLAAACGYPEMDLAPPPRPDKRAALQGEDPTHPSLKPNPNPATWMVDCFEIVVPDGAQAKNRMAFRFQLTTKPVEATYHVHQYYRAISLSSAGDRYRWRVWKPVSKNELEVEFNTGYEAAVFAIRRTSSGLSATVEFGSDTTFRERNPAQAEIRTVPCPHGAT